MDSLQADLSVVRGQLSEREADLAAREALLSTLRDELRETRAQLMAEEEKGRTLSLQLESGSRLAMDNAKTRELIKAGDRADEELRVAQA